MISTATVRIAQKRHKRWVLFVISISYDTTDGFNPVTYLGFFNRLETQLAEYILILHATGGLKIKN